MSAKTTIWTGATDGDFEKTGNWSNGVPVTGDTAIFTLNAEDVDTNLDQNAITLAKLVINQSYTGLIGTESAYLQISATVLEIGRDDAPSASNGSQRVKIDLGDVDSTATVYNTCATSADTGLEPVQLLMNIDSASYLNVQKGYVGVAVGNAAETSGITAVSITNGGRVRLGSGVSWVDASVASGALVAESAPLGNVAQYGGTITIEGTGTIPKIDNLGGTCYPNAAGTITALNVGGVVDMTKSASARTVTTTKMLAGGTLKRDPAVVTLTNGIAFDSPLSITAARAN